MAFKHLCLEQLFESIKASHSYYNRVMKPIIACIKEQQKNENAKDPAEIFPSLHCLCSQSPASLLRYGTALLASGWFHHWNERETRDDTMLRNTAYIVSNAVLTGAVLTWRGRDGSHLYHKHHSRQQRLPQPRHAPHAEGGGSSRRVRFLLCLLWTQEWLSGQSVMSLMPWLGFLDTENKWWLLLRRLHLWAKNLSLGVRKHTSYNHPDYIDCHV